MKVVFLSHYFYPHVGGVEKHVLLLSRELIKQGHQVTVITEQFNSELKYSEIIDGISVIRFKYPDVKFVGILYIWLFIWRKRKLFYESEVVHIHDVFIWYLPFKFLYISRRVYITIHGLEWGKPFSKSGILQKRIAVKLSNGSLGVGRFLEKYLKVKFDLLTYGAVRIPKLQNKKRNTIVFVGRLSKDTGVLKFLDYLKSQGKFKVSFIGDGEYRDNCEKYGKVYGFTDPQRFLCKSEYVVPGGYLSCFEAMANKCKIKIFWNDDLKKDYWKMSPMYKFIKTEDVQGGFEWVKKQSWKKLAKEYIDLWNR